MKPNTFPIALVASALCMMTGTTAIASDKWLGDRGDNWEEHIRSTKTRAQVIAELNEARAKGLLPNNGDASSYPEPLGAAIGRSRSEVRTETQEMRPQGGENGDYLTGR